MSLDEEEISRLRKELLTFLVNQLKESVRSGELSQLQEQINAPLAALVGAEVEKAVATALQADAASSLGDRDIDRIAIAVAAALPRHAAARPEPAHGDGQPQSAEGSAGDPDLRASPEELAEPTRGTAPPPVYRGEQDSGHGKPRGAFASLFGEPGSLRFFALFILAFLLGAGLTFAVMKALAPDDPYASTADREKAWLEQCERGGAAEPQAEQSGPANPPPAQATSETPPPAAGPSADGEGLR